MKPRMLLLAVVLAVGVAPAWSRAAVTEDQFPPRTTRDLLALCTAGKDDPLMTAALNFCHGFAEGAVEVQKVHDSVNRRKHLFGMPDPPLGRTQALAASVASTTAD